MNTNAIYYGKNIDTGSIEQLRSVSNVLLTSAGTLNNLNDVVITTPANNQVLKYSSPNWVNGSLSLDNLSDVSISGNLFNGDLLRYNTSTDKWENKQSQHAVFVMYGRTSPTVYATNTDKLILQSSSDHWLGTVPNPQNGINGYTSFSNNDQGSISFNSTTGVFTIDPNRRYIAMATLNLNGSNINEPTNYEMGFVNFSSGSKNNFSPNARTVFTQQIDFSGVGGTLSFLMSNVSAFSFILRIVTAQTVGTQGTDCNISITLIQI